MKEVFVVFFLFSFFRFSTLFTISTAETEELMDEVMSRMDTMYNLISSELPDRLKEVGDEIMAKLLGDVEALFDEKFAEVQDLFQQTLDESERIIQDKFGAVEEIIDDVFLRFNQEINAFEMKAYNFMGEVENLGYGMMDKFFSNVGDIKNKFVGELDSVLSNVESMTEDSLDRVEKLAYDGFEFMDQKMDDIKNIANNVDKVIDRALEVGKQLVDEIDRIEKELVKNLWEIIDEVECISLSSLQYVEFMVFSLVNSVTEHDHICRIKLGYQPLQKVPLHDILFQYRILKCKLLYNLDEHSGIELLLTQYNILLLRIRTFKCITMSSGYLYVYFQEEMNELANIIQNLNFFQRFILNETQGYKAKTLNNYFIYKSKTLPESVARYSDMIVGVLPVSKRFFAKLEVIVVMFITLFAFSWFVGIFAFIALTCVFGFSVRYLYKKYWKEESSYEVENERLEEKKEL